MIDNPQPGMRVRLGDVGRYTGSIVTLLKAESKTEWWFEVDPDHPMAMYGPKWTTLGRIYPIPTPPKFTSPEEADAWMDAHA